jgi:hypothetical protein
VVRDDIAVAVSKLPGEAPLNVLAVAKRTGFDRKTLTKYGLDAEIAALPSSSLAAVSCHPDRSRGDPIPTRCEGSLLRSAWRKAMPSGLVSTRLSFGSHFLHLIGQYRERAGGRHADCDAGRSVSQTFRSAARLKNGHGFWPTTIGSRSPNLLTSKELSDKSPSQKP